MDINVKVVNQEMHIATNLRCLPEGTQRFTRFIFDLPSDWDGLTVFAQFVQGSVGYNSYLDANHAAYLPSEVKAGKCLLILYGTGGDVRATTNYLALDIHDNHFVADAQSTVISQSLYTQLVNIVNTNKSDMDAALAQTAAAIIADVEAFKSEIRAMVGSPLMAATASAMTDRTKIYVYTGTETGYVKGDWYYWNGSSWEDGGIYNSVAIDIATLAEVQSYIN